MSAIDEFDARILRQLEMSGRMSWAELSSQVHLSPTAVADRVRRMERDGVIRGYQANVDPAAYGRTTRAVIEVGLIAGAHAEEFEERLRTGSKLRSLPMSPGLLITHCNASARARTDSTLSFGG